MKRAMSVNISFTAYFFKNNFEEKIKALYGQK